MTLKNISKFSLQVQLGPHIEETNGCFEIDIILRLLGTQSQYSRIQQSKFKRALLICFLSPPAHMHRFEFLSVCLDLTKNQRRKKVLGMTCSLLKF